VASDKERIFDILAFQLRKNAAEAAEMMTLAEGAVTHATHVIARIRMREVPLTVTSKTKNASAELGKILKLRNRVHRRGWKLKRKKESAVE